MIKWTARAILALLLLATWFIPSGDGPPLGLYLTGTVVVLSAIIGLVLLIMAAFGEFG